MEPLHIVILLVVVAVVLFVLFGRKKKPEEIEAPDEPKKLVEAPPTKVRPSIDPPEKRPTAKAEPVKSAPPPVHVEEEDEPEEVAPPAKTKSVAPSTEPERPSHKPAPVSKRPADVAGLRRGLVKSREKDGFFGKLRSLFKGKKEIDPALFAELEEVLLTGDVGAKTTEELISQIKEQLSKDELAESDKVWGALRGRAVDLLNIGGGGLALSAKPTVVMVVGVNGVGKTTTIGKLATRLTQQGKKVVLAAGDTFRAAAVDQLKIWAKRVGCEIVTGAEGANSGAVIFDAIQKAKEIGADVVLADTAGRLHTKTNLMDELKKTHRTLSKAMEGAPHETLLVLDATNGQNAIMQTAQFKEALPLSGIVLTKLDGTAKGGVILGICAEHQIPVRYIGIGEKAEDLRDFYADEFVEALLGDGGERNEEAA